MVVERKKEKKKETSNRTFGEKVVFISSKFYRESWKGKFKHNQLDFFLTP